MSRLIYADHACLMDYNLTMVRILALWYTKNLIDPCRRDSGKSMLNGMIAYMESNVMVKA